MLSPLLLGSATLLACLAIQLSVALALIGRLSNRERFHDRAPTFAGEFALLGGILLWLFLGHTLQIFIWAGLFITLGEFTDFATAFYHSAVNFATLGYGDIVMSEQWRLLGALEAGSGVFMFGLSTGTIMAVLNQVYLRRKRHLETGPGSG